MQPSPDQLLSGVICFVSSYDNEMREVHGMNGSGRAPLSLTLDTTRRRLAAHIVGWGAAMPKGLSVCLVGAGGERRGAIYLSMRPHLQPHLGIEIETALRDSVRHYLEVIIM